MIQTISVCSMATLRRNRAAAADRGLPWLAAAPARPDALAVVGGGRSVAEALPRLLAWPGAIMAINGAYDWMTEAGRVPDFVLACDPLPVLADILGRPAASTRYVIADDCDPALFDALAGQSVTLWRCRQGDEPALDDDVPGGCTAMTRAPIVGAILGFRDITLFGADSDFPAETSHVYGGALPADTMRVSVDGATYATTPGMLAQAEFLAASLPLYPFPVRLDGEHLAAAALRSRGAWEMAA